MRHTITLIPGDGIGPEVSGAVVKIVERAGLDVEWDSHVAGVLALQQSGATLPPELLDSIRRNKVALKGPLMTPVGGGFASVNVGLRKALDLFANLRPVWNIPSVISRYENVDLVIVRENTEDLYAGLEHEVVPGDERDGVSHARSRASQYSRAKAPAMLRSMRRVESWCSSSKRTRRASVAGRSEGRPPTSRWIASMFRRTMTPE